MDFKVIRPIFGGSLSQSQVDGINAIIAGHAKWATRKTNINDLAYELATVTWETGYAMQPLYEKGPKSYFNKYEPGTKIGKMLGNTLTGDGYRFRGTGLVQLTGRRNFAFWSKRLGIDLVANPARALELDIAVRILIEGMNIGAFTGKGTDDYIDDLDEDDIEDLREYKAARRVVNGTDKDDEIAELALKYEKALRASVPVIAKPTETVTSPLPATKNTRTFAVLAAILAAIGAAVLKLFGFAP